MTEKQISQSKKHFGYQVINRVQHKITGLFMRSYNQRSWWFGQGFTQSPNYNRYKKNYTVIPYVAIPIDEIADNTEKVLVHESYIDTFFEQHGDFFDKEFPKIVKNYNRNKIELITLELMAGSNAPIYYYIKYDKKYYNFVTRDKSGGGREYDWLGLQEVEIAIKCSYEFVFLDND